jgi:hypothetical protein
MIAGMSRLRMNPKTGPSRNVLIGECDETFVELLKQVVHKAVNSQENVTIVSSMYVEEIRRLVQVRYYVQLGREILGLPPADPKKANWEYSAC